MKKYWKILLSLTGGMLAYLSIYSIWKRPEKMIPLVYVKAEKVALLPKDKEISISTKKFVERRRERARAKWEKRGLVL